MGKCIGGFLLGLIALGRGGAWATEAMGGVEDSVPKITLRVYNYARAPTPILASTEPVATKIFRQAGIETEWLDCRLSRAEPRTPACERPLTASDLILKLLPASMAQTIGANGDTFGIALTVDGKPAKDAIIFYQRALDIARTGYVREQEILAAAMAHEIGHLLLGSDSHSPTGIMRAKWTRDELELVRLGRLLFTPQQSTLLRAEVSARAGQAPPGVSKLNGPK
jgi:hypothetical protein